MKPSKNRPLFALLCAALVPAGAAGADPGLLSLADPNVNFVVGIDVRQLAQSALVQELLTKAKSEKPELNALLAAAGNPIEKLEEILIVGQVESAGQDAKGLVLARGNFSDPAILAAICHEGCETVNYQGFEMHQTALNDEPGSFVQLDDNYAALGTPAEVRGVVDRRSRGEMSSLGAKIQNWASGLGRHQLWLAARGPFEAPSADGPPALGAAAESLEAFSLGLSMGADVEFGLELRAVDSAKAQQLYEMAQGLLLLASAGQQQNPEAAELLRSLSLEHNGSSVVASLRVPEERLAQAIRSGVTAQSEVAHSSSGAVAPHSSPPQPKQGVIRVYGLEEEAVEFKSGQNATP